MKKISRRRFLEAGAFSSIAMIGGMTVKLPVPQSQNEAPKQGSAPSVLEGHERDLLRSAMDEIIPAGDGMPAASEVGSMNYLEQVAVQYPQVGKELQEGLQALDVLSRTRRQVSFSTLTHEQRVEILTALEEENASAFISLQKLVYEAYYTRPAVWKLIGYDFYPTDSMGPPVKKEWNDAVLDKVRTKPKGYREVS